jgi:hypothetical protein
VVVEGEVLLADAQDALRGLPRDVHVEAGPGADDDVGVERLQALADPLVGQLAVLAVAVLGGREHLRRAPVQGMVRLLAQVHQRAQAHAGIQDEIGVLPVT